MKKIFLILVLLVLIYGCVQERAVEKSESEVKQDVSAEIVGPSDPARGEVKEFAITAKQWEFDPNTIEVNQGDAVRLVITSIDVTHGFELPAYGIVERLEPNQEVVIEFVADREGLFFFRCNVFCGRGHSAMNGKLIVR